MPDETHQWFIYRGPNFREGPYSPQDLRDSVRRGFLKPDDLLWREGMRAPEKARHLDGLFGELAHQWFIYRSPNLREGPYSQHDIRAYVRKGSLKLDDLLWREGMASPEKARHLSELFGDITQHWFIYRGPNLREGPYSTQDLRDSVSKGLVRPDDLLWREGMPAPEKAHHLEDFFSIGRQDADSSADIRALVNASSAVAPFVEASSPVAQPVFAREYASRPADSTPPAPASVATGVVAEKKSNPFALAGFCLGVSSVLLSFLGIIPLLGMAVSAIGLVTFDGSRHRNKWQARWGLGLSLVYMLVNMYLNGHFGG